MIKRYRWFSLKFPFGHEFLIRIMAGEPISPENKKGFQITYSDDGEIKFKFFWQTKIIAKTMSVDGEESSEEIYTLESQDCLLKKSGEKYILRLDNPGRSLRELFNSLEDISGMGFYVKPLYLSDETVSHIKSKIDICKTVGVKISGGIGGNEVVARVDLASKKGIKIDEISILSGMKYKTESASYELILKGEKGNFSYTSSGLVKLSGKLAPMVLFLIEEAMINKSEGVQNSVSANQPYRLM